MFKKFLIMIIPFFLMGISYGICATFTDFTEEADVPGAEVGNGLAFVDYDVDGDLDLYVSADPHDILYRNNGDGTFSDATIEAGIFVKGDGVGAVFGDYDNDGDPDLYIPVNDGWDIFFQNEGAGIFRDATRDVRINNPNRGRSAAFADFNNDSFLDIYVTNESAPNILYKNRSGKSFEDVAQEMNVAHPGNGRCGTWADYDNDGDMDLYVTNKGESNLLYRNDSFGFKDVAEDAGVDIPDISTGAAFADYDNDGDLDLCVDGGREVYLYRNENDGTFTNVAPELGISYIGKESTPAFGDYDNDGHLDLYLAVWNGWSVMFHNKGDGSFEEVTHEVGLGDFGNSWSAIFSDYDSDGDLDLYTTYTTKANKLYLNNGSDNNWLYIKLTGTSSNRDGIGTRLNLSVGGINLIRETTRGSGYGSQNSPVVEFGLGNNDFINVLNIFWPSGIVTKLTNIKANQVINAEESFWSVDDSKANPISGNKDFKSYTDYDKKYKSRLLPNYPNPFNPETWIPYQLAEQSNITINIYDSSGCLVRSMNMGFKFPGLYASKELAAYWDGKNDKGEKVSSGIYFCRIIGRDFQQTAKMILKR
ncbi:hypothetical protein GF312_17160 [Candidatus Poribacteria bacterium]|nr:hypothetical protein [Candidatus Poribacteria bacterium]